MNSFYIIKIYWKNEFCYKKSRNNQLKKFRSDQKRPLW